MERRPLKTREKKWVSQFVQWLIKRNVKPNQVSVAGIGFALAAGALFLAATVIDSRWVFLLTACCIQLRLLCNMMDGMLAMEGKIQSPLGDVFNELPDRYEDIVILACAGAACFHPALGWAAATFAVLTAYVRAFGASIGTRQYFSGPMAKPHRMFTLTVASLLEFLLPSGRQFITLALGIVIVGCLVTSIRRRKEIVKELQSQPMRRPLS